MADGKAIEIRFYGPLAAQIAEIERLSGKSAAEIVCEAVNVVNWLKQELRSGAKLHLQRPGADGQTSEVRLQP